MQQIPPVGSDMHALDVSASGTYVVGGAFDKTATPFLWSETGGTQRLTTPIAFSASANGVSANGAIVVGGVSGKAYRWISGTGAELKMPVAGESAEAFAVSDDGSVIVGRAMFRGLYTRAASWDAAGNVMEIKSGSNEYSSAYAISGDGKTSGGATGSGGLMRATLWQGAAELTLQSGIDARVNAINRDGSVAVGQAGGRAFYWTKNTGAVDLLTYFMSQGVHTEGWVLNSANAISADGRYVAGSGSHFGRPRAWLIRPSQVELLDAMPFAARIMPHEVRPDREVPRTKGIPRTGVSADGSARLLIRCKSRSPTQFTLRIDTQGGVESTGAIAKAGIRPVSNVPVTIDAEQVGATSEYDAQFVYRAPTNYADPNADEIVVELLLSTQSTDERIPIRIRRPVVVLAHGLRSSRETWSGEFRRFADDKDDGFEVYLMDYSATSAERFIDNVIRVVAAIDHALSTHRVVNDIAASKVDWVGHSMGAILPRVYYRL
ncbi:MAG: alpha/beta fold hydrolase, partial [Planctomycetes bacterium]|nr:alpha/beta fold hydrolase [Planctomycetota bacterium]